MKNSKYPDLATSNPELVKEWHPSKNGNLSPTEVSQKSGKNVWWICEKGHEWQAKVYTRTNGHVLFVTERNTLLFLSKLCFII